MSYTHCHTHLQFLFYFDCCRPLNSKSVAPIWVNAFPYSRRDTRVSQLHSTDTDRFPSLRLVRFVRCACNRYHWNWRSDLTVANSTETRCRCASLCTCSMLECIDGPFASHDLDASMVGCRKWDSHFSRHKNKWMPLKWYKCFRLENTKLRHTYLIAHSSSNDDHICGRSFESSLSLSKSGSSVASTFVYSSNRIAPISMILLVIIAFVISFTLRFERSFDVFFFFFFCFESEAIVCTGLSGTPKQTWWFNPANHFCFLFYGNFSGTMRRPFLTVIWTQINASIHMAGGRGARSH